MSLPDALGLGGEIDYGGEVYRPAPLDTLNVQAKYARYLRGCAVKEVQELQGELDPFTIDRMLAAITRDFAAGAYRWGQPLIRESMKVEANQKRLLLYMLQENHSKATPSLVDELWKNAMDQVLGALDFFINGARPPAKATTAVASPPPAGPTSSP